MELFKPTPPWDMLVDIEETFACVNRELTAFILTWCLIGIVTFSAGMTVLYLR